MGDLSHRLEVIESQLNLVLEHLPFFGGAEQQSVSSDAGGAGSEVDSGLQEDHVGGPGGSNDGRGGGSSSGGGADGSGQGDGAGGERTGGDGGDAGGDDRKEDGDCAGGGEGEKEKEQWG